MHHDVRPSLVMTIIIIVRSNHDVMTLTITSRVDRDGEAEVCSERDTHHPVAALAWSDHDHHHHEDCQRWQLEMKNQSKLKRLNRSSLVSVHSSGLLRWTTFQKIKEMFVKLKSKSLYSQQMGVGRGQQALNYILIKLLLVIFCTSFHHHL